MIAPRRRENSGERLSKGEKILNAKRNHSYIDNRRSVLLSSFRRRNQKLKSCNKLRVRAFQSISNRQFIRSVCGQNRCHRGNFMLIFNTANQSKRQRENNRYESFNDEKNSKADSRNLKFFWSLRFDCLPRNEKEKRRWSTTRTTISHAK